MRGPIFKDKAITIRNSYYDCGQNLPTNAHDLTVEVLVVHFGKTINAYQSYQF